MTWFLISAFVTFGSAPLVRSGLVRRGILDRPTARSCHTVATPRGGGLACVVGVVAALAAGQGLDRVVPWSLVAAALLMASVGFADDACDVPARMRLVAQVAVAAAMGAAVGGGWWYVVALLAVPAVINAVNFMDGINGLTALTIAVWGLTAWGVGAAGGSAGLQVIGAASAGASLGFLPWNVPVARLFLGDVGSYFFGGLVAAGILVGAAQGAPVVLLVAPLVLYLADTGAVLLRHLLRGQSLFRSHREHVYQRLTHERGRTHTSVSVAMAAAAAAVTWSWTARSPWISVGVTAVAVVGYLTSVRWVPVRRAPGRGERAPGAVGGPQEVRGNGAGAFDVAVVGASGFVGSAVAAALTARGWRVRAVRAPRPPDLARLDVVPYVEACSGPVDVLAEELRGAIAVVNAAGIADAGRTALPPLLAANAAVPALVARAARAAQVARFVQVSSAAVQGGRGRLDSSREVEPFSPYSSSKAWGERLAAHYFPGAVVYRPAGVHGPGRRTTVRLGRVARSRYAVVAAPGDGPTPQALVANVADAIAFLATCPAQPPPVVAHPWEGLTTRSLLVALGDRAPHLLPAAPAHALRRLLRGAASVPLAGPTARRVELLVFGQDQAASWLETSGWTPPVDPAGPDGWRALGTELRAGLEPGRGTTEASRPERAAAAGRTSPGPGR